MGPWGQAEEAAARGELVVATAPADVRIELRPEGEVAEHCMAIACNSPYYMYA